MVVSAPWLALSWPADQPQPSRDDRGRLRRVVRRCKEDQADAALLLPNCPVCTRGVSLAASALEESGIATW